MSKYDLFDIVVEINAASMIITGLSNQLDEDCTKLKDENMKTALYGVASYLDRIASSIEEIDESTGKAGVANETN